jgi:hypothetical protein
MATCAIRRNEVPVSWTPGGFYPAEGWIEREDPDGTEGTEVTEVGHVTESRKVLSTESAYAPGRSRDFRLGLRMAF